MTKYLIGGLVVGLVVGGIYYSTKRSDSFQKQDSDENGFGEDEKTRSGADKISAEEQKVRAGASSNPSMSLADQKIRSGATLVSDQSKVRTGATRSSFDGIRNADERITIYF